MVPRRRYEEGRRSKAALSWKGWAAALGLREPRARQVQREPEVSPPELERWLARARLPAQRRNWNPVQTHLPSQPAGLDPPPVRRRERPRVRLPADHSVVESLGPYCSRRGTGREPPMRTSGRASWSEFAKQISYCYSRGSSY